MNKQPLIHEPAGHRLSGQKQEARRGKASGTRPLLAVLVLAVVSTAFLATLASSQAARPSDEGNPLSAMALAVNPELAIGTWVTFTCTNGTISLGGIGVVCNHGSGNYELCDSSSCQYSMTGSFDSGWTFTGWVIGGQVGIGCGSCLSTTLTVYTPNPNNHYSGAITLGLAGTGGTYVTFRCPDGTINLTGVTDCNHTNITSKVCDSSSSCIFELFGAPSPGWAFAQWNVSGEASVQNTSDPDTQLTVFTPYPTRDYSATLTLGVDPAVIITVHTYEDWATGSTPATVTACGPYFCYPPATNSMTLSLRNGLSYKITANDNSGYYFIQWTASAGSLSNPTGNPTQFTPEGSGVLSLITNISDGYAGYIYSPPTSGGAVTSVAEEFQLVTGGNQPNVVIWAGIGGFPIGNLWQAGIEVNSSSSGVISIVPFWEACGNGNCTVVHWNPSDHAVVGDTMSVTISSSGGDSSFAIKDVSQGWSWSGSDTQSFTPVNITGDWVEEWVGSQSEHPVYPEVDVTYIAINGANPTMYGCYLGTVFSYPPDDKYSSLTALSSGPNSPEFTIN